MSVEIEQLAEDILVFLAATVAVVPVSKKLGITPILGFIIAGVLIGPGGLKLVGSPDADVELGDIGILFLLFNEGLELSKERFSVLVQFAFRIGLPQIFLSTTAIAATIFSTGVSIAGVAPAEPTCLFIIGATGALSSSAFVFPVLKEQGWEERRLGVASCGVLLLQDLLVAPLLVVLPLLSGGENPQSIALVLLKAAVGFGLVVAAGSVVLQKIFEVVVDTRSMDTFVAAALLVAIGMGALAQACGLSAATGAFAAGVLLAGTDYRAQIQADIRPFQGILLGIFFMTAGAGLDLALVSQELPTVLSLVGTLIIVKAAMLGLIMPFTSLSVRDAARMSVLLAGGGEFAFVVLTLSKDLELLPGRLCDLLIAVVILSMSLTPFLGQAGDALGQWLQGATVAGPVSEAGALQQQADDDLEHHQDPEDAEANGIVICGFGNVGQGISRVVSQHLEGYGGPIVCFDLNPARIAEGALSGQPVVYGDGASPKVLRSAGVVKPRVIVMAYNNLNVRLAGLRQLRLAFPGVPIISRAKAPKEREKLMEAGATSVLFESEEVAVKLSQAIFSEVGERLDVDVARLSVQGAANLARRNGADFGSDIDADLDLLAMDSGFPRQEVIRLYRIFEGAGLDGNGEIDPLEAEEIIARASDTPMSEADFREYMSILDADNSGRVCFEDFLSVYARGCVPGGVPTRPS